MDSEMMIKELANGLQIFQLLIQGVSQSEAGVKPNPEAWSVLEVMGHLYDEECDDFQKLLDLILHHPGKEWPEPHNRQWFNNRLYNQQPLADLLNGFCAARTQNLAWLQALSAPDWTTTYSSDFGQMQAGDMLAAWVAHDTLHIRQLVELRWNRIVTCAQPFDVRYAGDW
jgi:hypothetical protein